MITNGPSRREVERGRCDRLAAEHVLSLHNGRELAFVRWNEGGRFPLLFCHGTPGSRLFRPPDPTLLIETAVGLVTVDRPGYGRSTPKPGRTLLAWADDVAALAESLGWQRFAVAGISGGGPHALACGFALKSRVTVIALISSVAPFWPGALRGMLPTTRLGFRLAHWASWLLALMARRTARHPERFLAKLKKEFQSAIALFWRARRLLAYPPRTPRRLCRAAKWPGRWCYSARTGDLPCRTSRFRQCCGMVSSTATCHPPMAAGLPPHCPTAARPSCPTRVIMSCSTNGQRFWQVSLQTDTGEMIDAIAKIRLLLSPPRIAALTKRYLASIDLPESLLDLNLRDLRVLRRT